MEEALEWVLDIEEALDSQVDYTSRELDEITSSS